MGNPQPLEVVMDFIKRINSGDVNSVCELMTEGHIFQDALGKRMIGRENMRQGWTMYLKMVSDYQIHADEFYQTDDRLAILGTASGRYNGIVPGVSNGFWEVPAAWRAQIKDGLIAEWRVYADNQPLRKLTGESVP